MPPARTPGAARAIAAVCVLPFLAGAVLPVRGGELDVPGLPCPFAATTGVPCPLCGSSRAFALLMHRDPAWTRYNAAVVGLFALVLAGALVAAALPFRSENFLKAVRRRVPLRAWLGLAVAFAWLYALQQRTWIT